MKTKFMDHAKVAGYTVAEVGVIGASMLLQKKFLDFKTLFKNQIAADPKYADKWFIKHEGAVKLVAFSLAASYVKNPWIKLALIGVAAGGFIQEVRVLTSKEDGTNFFDQIGNRPIQTGQENNELDQQMMRIAEEASGTKANQYHTAVGGPKVTQQYPIAVGMTNQLKIIPALGNDNAGNHAVGFVSRPIMAA